MNGEKYFRCDGCAKIKLINEQNIRKVAYTQFNSLSHDQLRYCVHYVQLCNKCVEGKEDVKDTN